VQWECGFDTETASVRERAIWRVLQSKFYGNLPEMFFYPVRLLPSKKGPSLEVKSGRLEVTTRRIHSKARSIVSRF
jgi:hypothetical protein